MRPTATATSSSRPGIRRKKISAKIDAAFEQLFHGDPETQAVYYPAGQNANGPLAYLSDINNHDVRSEGMSYGMMIAVQLDKKAEFDALWNWSKTYMYHVVAGSPCVRLLLVVDEDWTARRTASRRRRTAKSIGPWRCISRPAGGATARASTTIAPRPTGCSTT